MEEILRRAAELDGVSALVYADWLEEQGRTGEADMIRDLAGPGGDAGWSDGYGDG